MKVYNTLSGQKEEFLPPGSEVRMYVCGVTPYDESHIGHAMSYIIFDVIRRYLRYRGYKVKSVQNVTDIDDKIIDRANRLGIPARELAEEHTASFQEDMRALNVLPPDESPRATDTIPEIIEFVKGLVDKGYAYPARGSVYFRVRQVPDYGKLSHRNLDSMMAGARIEPGEEKEYPMDFVLWKAAKPGEPAWDSPWGPGRPGWHIECSAMSLKYLGQTLDIHGGGQDLIFPHHENEIAQSESYTGVKPFVRYWMHNGLLQLGAEKMSKSLGNLITIKDALQKYSADAIRIFILSSHYRSPLTYSEEALEAAEKGAERLAGAYSRSSSGDSTKGPLYIKLYREQFFDAMDDDFNTARALARVFELAAVINQAAGSGRHSIEDAKQLLRQLACEILGLSLEERDKLEVTPEIAPTFAKNLVNASVANIALANSVLDDLNRINSPASSDIHEAVARIETTCKDITENMKIATEVPILYNTFVANVDAQIYLRTQLRKAKQWQLADEIRAKLDELGIVLEDTPTETKWKRRR
jgi:cysteinyl-tRNA synthetase